MERALGPGSGSRMQPSMPSSSRTKLVVTCSLGIVLVLVLAGVVSGAGGPADSVAGSASAYEGATNGAVALQEDGDADPVAHCSVSDASVQVGDSVTLDASASENVADFQYDGFGSGFGDFTNQPSRTVTYLEAGTYDPRVKVWNYAGGEESDVAPCGTVTVSDATPTPTPTPAPSPIARCSVSDASIEVGDSVTLDASASENVVDFQYDGFGSGFGDFTNQPSRTVTYLEAGTYDPRVKVWNYAGGEASDVASCGSVTVTDSTPTPTPAPSPVARCTVSDTSVQVGDSVTLDASASENVVDFQYDGSGSGFGDFTNQPSRTVTYLEAGTYDPRVKGWNYADGEESDVASCGTVTVSAATPTSTPTSTPAPSPAARCSVSDTSVQVGDSVTLDASASENAVGFQYDGFGSGFGSFTSQPSRTVSYGEVGTYHPRVKVWNYAGGEEASDVASCGSVTVTGTTPTPAPSPDAACSVSDRSVRTGVSVTLDASDSEHADAYQYDSQGSQSFGQFTSQASRTVAYAEAGTYNPRVKVWNYAGTEVSDVATCGTVTVSEPTPTSTPTSTAERNTASSTATAGTPDTGGAGTATDTESDSSGDDSGTQTASGANFEYDPANASTDDSIRLTADSGVPTEDVAAYRWDLDGDGVPERTGRTITVPGGSNGNSSTVTLVVERTDGSIRKVTRDVPIDSTGVGGEVPSETPNAGPGNTDGRSPFVWALLVVVLLGASLGVLALRRRGTYPGGD